MMKVRREKRSIRLQIIVLFTTDNELDLEQEHAAGSPLYVKPS
jgi:hypothetical protein